MSEIITEYRNENTKNIDLLSTIDIVRKITVRMYRKTAGKQG